MHTTPIKGQRVLITGASSGIGAACAMAFAVAGADLVLVARRQVRLDALADQIRQQHGVDCASFVCDISDSAAVTNMFEALEKTDTRIDIVINNAGLALGLDTVQTGKVDEWEQMIDTNIKGLLYVTRCCLDGMISRNRGYIFNLASTSSHYVYSGGAVYCATKFAVDGFTRGLRFDLLGKNIRLTQISPGAVESEFSLVRYQGNQHQADNTYAGMQPLVPQDIANLIVHCASLPAHVSVNELIVTPTAQAETTIYRQEA